MSENTDTIASKELTGLLASDWIVLYGKQN
uniref:Uncharacterized protein n=1 Tax=Ochrobactrum phage ORM_20 TaxID=2985243 RepID=A0A9N6WUU2_9VIRU|nr:hypothetical protein ORM20_00045 [Ochrobactrum phage ORM_20]